MGKDDGGRDLNLCNLLIKFFLFVVNLIVWVSRGAAVNTSANPAPLWSHLLYLPLHYSCWV